MTFDILTIFPEFFRSILEHGILKRALSGRQIEVCLRDLRDFTDDVHRTVDDRPFGGGPGMVFTPEPIFRALDAIKAEAPQTDFPVILLSPQGRLLRQAIVEELATVPHIVLICGRYEGVDNRVAEALATDEISIGDYVLSGGELAAAVVMESCTRLLPGVMGNEASGEEESFSRGFARSRARVAADGAKGNHKASARSGPSSAGGLLGFPQYTRPADFRGLRVPEVLLSGNHEEIRRWRRRQALEKTWRRRPDLLGNCALSPEDKQVLDQLKRGASEHAPT